MGSMKIQREMGREVERERGREGEIERETTACINK